MPSINHLANSRLAFNSHLSQKNQLKSYSFKSATKPHFGMQSDTPTAEKPGCLATILNCFRNLFKRQPSAPVTSVMQESTPLRGSGEHAEDRDYLSNESAVSAPKALTIQVSTKGQSEGTHSPTKPIPIVRKTQEVYTAPPTENFEPSSPPQSKPRRQKMQRLYGAHA